ncbi:MAG: MBL fold metallo-hydrolase, partial [Lachnospiraceae bacterium]|nr:MBL fold metallo-hydrolase [Lachnospiraceae bacterium]
MRPEIIFMPLGGGQRVGASCYYLKIGDSNILLDAGIGVDQGMEFEPDFHCLLTSPFMQSMG